MEGWRRPLLLAAGCWAAFLVVLVCAYAVPWVEWADGWAVQGFLSLQHPLLSDLAWGTAKLADPAPFAVLLLALALFALRRGLPRHALAVVALCVGANVVTQTLKQVLAQPRLHDFLGDAQLAAASYPSGHATAAMSIAIAAVLVASPPWRAAAAVAGGLYALAVSESILVLAWHFPSDVAGGFLVAAACGLTTLAALRAAEARWPERSGREAARRALGSYSRRGLGASGATAVVVASVMAALGALALAAGRGTLAFADDHTTAVAAVIAVAALASALPVAVAGRYR